GGDAPSRSFFRFRFSSVRFLARTFRERTAARLHRAPHPGSTRRISAQCRHHHVGRRRNGRANRNQHSRSHNAVPFLGGGGDGACRALSHAAAQQHRRHLAAHGRKLSARAPLIFQTTRTPPGRAVKPFSHVRSRCC